MDHLFYKYEKSTNHWLRDLSYPKVIILAEFFKQFGRKISLLRLGEWGANTPWDPHFNWSEMNYRRTVIVNLVKITFKLLFSLTYLIDLFCVCWFCYKNLRVSSWTRNNSPIFWIKDFRGISENINIFDCS